MATPKRISIDEGVSVCSEAGIDQVTISGKVALNPTLPYKVRYLTFAVMINGSDGSLLFDAPHGYLHRADMYFEDGKPLPGLNEELKESISWFRDEHIDNIPGRPKGTAEERCRMALYLLDRLNFHKINYDISFWCASQNTLAWMSETLQVDFFKVIDEKLVLFKSE